MKYNDLHMCGLTLLRAARRPLLGAKSPPFFVYQGRKLKFTHIVNTKWSTMLCIYSGDRKYLRIPCDSIIKKSQVSWIYMISRWNLVDICIGRWATCHDSQTWNFRFRIWLALAEGQSWGVNADVHNSLKIHHRIMKLDMNFTHGWQ